jgi:four helix bundle protein
MRLSHHRLEVYGVAKQLAVLVHQHPIKDSELRSQGRRASTSVVLNIAEGAGLDRGAGVRHFRIARGSCHEVLACYELAAAFGEDVPLDQVTALGARTIGMLTGLVKPRR